MSSRERVLLLIVGGLVLVIGAAIIVPFYLKRLSEANARVAKAQKGLDDKNRAILTEEANLKRTQTLSPRLQEWRKMSLPDVGRGDNAETHQSKLQIHYQQYLTELLTKSGLHDTVVKPGKFDNKQTPQFAKDKPIYGVQSFTVEARGTGANVIKFFEGMHRTPLLHQVKTFSLVRPTGTTDRNLRDEDLKVKMTVEVLQVTGAEKMVDPKSEEAKKNPLARTTWYPKYSQEVPPPASLAVKTRAYEDMTAKNLFNLNPPPVRPTTRGEDPPTTTMETKPHEKIADVLSFVRLTSIDYTEGVEERSPAWEASLLNLNRTDVDEATGKSRLDVSRFRMYHAGNRMRVGWDEFRILDKYNNEVLKGATLRIEPRSLLVLVDGKVFRVNLGQSLQEATKKEKALDEKELKELKIELPKEPEKTTDKKDPDKKEPDKKESDKKEPDKKDSGTKDSGKKEPDKKDPDKKDSGAKDSGTKDPDNKDSGMKEPDKKEPDKKDLDKKDPDKKEPSKVEEKKDKDASKPQDKKDK